MTSLAWHSAQWKAHVGKALKNGALGDKWTGAARDKRAELRIAEEDLLASIKHPPSNVINDMYGEKQFVYNMNNGHMPIVPYDEHYTPNFNDLMYDRAERICSHNKRIDFLWSGGIDSTAALLALDEYAYKDQLRIISATDEAIDEAPSIYDHVVKKHEHVINIDLFGASSPDTNMFVTGCEADTLMGSTLWRTKIGEKIDMSDKDTLEYIHKSWPEKIRYQLGTRSWRYMSNVSCDKINMSHYSPFYLDANIIQFFINKHICRDMVYVLARPCEEYLKSKMDIRNFIIKACGDTEYALGKNKEMNIRPYIAPQDRTKSGVVYDGSAPITNAGLGAEDLRVIAVTSKGDIITKANITDYFTVDVFTKPIRDLCNV